jgi:hypothetical protein
MGLYQQRYWQFEARGDRESRLEGWNEAELFNSLAFTKWDLTAIGL